MYYSDTNRVLEEIEAYFESKFSERFEMEKGYMGKSVVFKSKSMSLEVSAGFIQARTQEDFNCPITERLNIVLDGKELERDKEYCFTTKISDNDFPIEYCVQEL